MVAGALFVIRRFINTHGDVLALLPQRVDDRTGFGIKADFWTVITDLFNHRASQLVKVDHGFAANFSSEHDDAGLDHGLAGDPRFAVLRQHGIDHGIRYLISNFVWVAFRNGFGSK